MANKEQLADSHIARLRAQAFRDGDLPLVETCDKALFGFGADRVAARFTVAGHISVGRSEADVWCAWYGTLDGGVTFHRMTRHGYGAYEALKFARETRCVVARIVSATSPAGRDIALFDVTGELPFDIRTATGHLDEDGVWHWDHELPLVDFMQKRVEALWLRSDEAIWQAQCAEVYPAEDAGIVAWGSFGLRTGFGPLRRTVGEAEADLDSNAPDREVVAVDGRGVCWRLLSPDTPEELYGWIAGVDTPKPAKYSEAVVALVKGGVR